MKLDDRLMVIQVAVVLKKNAEGRDDCIYYFGKSTMSIEPSHS